MRLLWFNLATDEDDPVLGFTASWIRAVAARVERIDVLTLRAGRFEPPANVRLFSAGVERGHGKIRRVAEFYARLRRLLETGSYDAVFSHMSTILTVLSAPMILPRRIPVVGWYAHRSVNVWMMAAHHLSRRVVTNVPTGYRYRTDRVTVLGHGIDTASFSPDGGRAQARPPYLLSVGRLSPVKDPITLVEAQSILRGKGFALDCVFVGDAPVRDRAYAARLHDTVSRLGLDSVVAFPGATQPSGMPAWYRGCAAHVNLCPDGSLDKAALEAMVCGRPSLAANVGFEDTLGPWAPLLMFRHGDANDLAMKLAEIIAMPMGERARMGDDLRARVVERHSLEGLSRRLVDVLDCARAEGGPVSLRTGGAEAKSSGEHG